MKEDHVAKVLVSKLGKTPEEDHRLIATVKLEKREEIRMLRRRYYRRRFGIGLALAFGGVMVSF